MEYFAKAYDVAVIGAGHAGIEAGLAAARLGCSTAVFTINMDWVGNMPCNPSIGGTSKGHLVREIDALGGEMGKAADRYTLQSRMLNLGKGPAVHSLRAQMSVMMQDSFIFSGTIMDNIRYGRLDATDEEIIAAAKTVRAHEFISEMPDGYYTQVNERGSRLSQGQKQLIAFARTLLSDPKILVLDEATSSIDAKTERLLQEGLQALLKGRTSFIIAHRLSTIKNCDRILYISNKGIAESGSHDELMEQKGHYYQLYTAQLEE